MPYLFNSCIKAGLTLIACEVLKYFTAINPPITIPATKNKFHNSFFQLYLKNLMSEGMNAAHICLKFDEIPKLLLPNISSNGTTNPIRVPVIYHGHGCLINSIIYERFIFQNCIKNLADSIKTFDLFSECKID